MKEKIKLFTETFKEEIVNPIFNCISKNIFMILFASLNVIISSILYIDGIEIYIIVYILLSNIMLYIFFNVINKVKDKEKYKIISDIKKCKRLTKKDGDKIYAKKEDFQKLILLFSELEDNLDKFE